MVNIKKYNINLNQVIKFHVRHSDILFVLIIVTIGSAYFVPFIQKVFISPYLVDWPLIEQFDVATQRYFNRGWLEFLSLETKRDIIDIVGFVSIPLMITAFLLEGLSIILLLKRNLTAILLSIYILFHLSIFLLSGVFFYKWMIVVLMFTLVVCYLNDDTKKVYDPTYILLSILLISFSWFYMNTTKLGWYSLDLDTHYYMKVATDDNKVLYVNPNDMSPFSMYFSFNTRWDAYNGNLIAPSTLDYSFLEQFNSMSFNEKKTYVETDGLPSSTSADIKVFSKFIREYYSNYNVRNNKKTILSYIPNLPHLLLWEDYSNSYRFDSAVKSVSVYLDQCYYDEELRSVCYRKLVFEIDDINIGERI